MSFRKQPPWSLVLELFRILKLPNDFPVTFTKHDIKLDDSDEAVFLLHPYYRPSRAYYLEQMDELKWLTVIRQCLGSHGYLIHRHETTRDGKKATVYTAQQATEMLVKPVTLDFS